jgi:primosomal protein N' (replication factor Y)
MYYEVIPAKGFGRDGVLTYKSSDSLLPGKIVEVPLGRKKSVGVVAKKVAQPDFDCKEICRIIYSKPLPAHLMSAVKFIAEYYKASLSNAVSVVLPVGVEKKRRKTEQMFGDIVKTEHVSDQPKIQLNQAQKNALKSLQEAPGATKLLCGVTGSGKTNIYLSEASRALLAQKSVVLLVPEIALTGQLVRVFSDFFGNKITVIHSKQTEAERHLIFERLLAGEGPRVVIGARSALFAPLNNLGLIIIDEEHENSYYQENAPRYSAVRVASYMAKKLDVPLILGSATPAIEDYYLAKANNSLVILDKKAKDEAIKPEISVIDFKQRENFSRNRYFSDKLVASIRKNLESGHQTLIFHNRRGSSPLTICEKCGEEILCPNCYLPLTLHADTYELICHTCEYKCRVPSACPKCGAPDLIHKGFGTKLLESELNRLFPKARIRRFDADTKKGEGLNEVYDEVKSGGVDIIIGTQTVAKGLDLPLLATVGVVQADAGLSLPDFAAEERTFQLITQVIGRVGRGHISKAEVFIQTFRPEHPAIKYAISEDYLGFAEYLLKRRRLSHFPPYTFVLKMEITMKTEATVVRKVRELYKRLSDDNKLIVSPPQPAFHEHTSRGYTWQIVVRSKSRKTLIDVCDELDQNWHISIDPPGLL